MTVYELIQQLAKYGDPNQEITFLTENRIGEDGAIEQGETAKCEFCECVGEQDREKFTIYLRAVNLAERGG